MDLGDVLMKKSLLVGALTLASASALAQNSDVARVLEQQTQELLNAVSSGDARVWDRYLDANAIYLAEDGTRKTKAALLKEIFLRGADGRITGFVDRREGRDIPWTRVP
jgi:hypothetical protein